MQYTKNTTRRSLKTLALFTVAVIMFMGTICIAQPAAQTFPPIGPNMKPQYKISVSVAGENIGDIEVELDPQIAPKHVKNFDSLVAIKFYDSTLFHRVIPGFVIQGGDPNTKSKPRQKWGFGDSTQTKVPLEVSHVKHVRGTVSAARSSDPNSATSQFFICVDEASNLDNNYSAFGMVLKGMEVVDKIVELPRDEKERPIERVMMMIVRIK